ncbi:hypothetical protein OBBRIDRAFT_887826 [Obba rivulosa]|uniref:Yeast cell wall synthesis Kre9/Knh1-like N-terminal domain-containing protein n=1 Tax=Obba rivulosa TaxID=1052685 RepID=A0A8E2AY67_9APHY|nr:hypothetical protein OBBRIDRAFT_887826 [Obba rivulosa]
MRLILAIFSLTGLAFGYQIISPNSTSGWTTEGPNVVTWTKLATDPPNFSLLLQFPVSGGGEELALVADVNGDLGQLVVPSFEVSPGNGFRVNFVDVTDNDEIFAQSAPFSIVPSN